MNGEAWGAPVAEVRQAFDEEKALAEIREQIALRNEAKGEYGSAIIRTGEILLKVKQQYPNSEPGKGYVRFGKINPQFIAFCEKAGISETTARHYIRFARNPEVLVRKTSDNRISIIKRGGQVAINRRKTLTEIRDALLDSTREEVLEAINLELAGTFPNVEAKS